MAARLRLDAEPRVHEQDARVGGRGARDHVARVLLVAGAVGEDEAPAIREEGAVGDVDRDALLALGAQPVGQQRQVEVAAAAARRHVAHVLHLIVVDLPRVVQQPPDQGGLAVVDGAAGRQAQQRRLDLMQQGGRLHQKYPSRLRSSIAASVARSSARVSPRSVIRVAAISATTSSIVAAVLRTAPVQVMSPTVR